MTQLRHLCKGAIAILAIASICAPQITYAETSANTIHVSSSGNDASGCGSTAAPCRSLQYAVNSAASGDTILVGAGTYTFTEDTCGRNITAVMCIPANKSLIVRGGYNASSWSGPNLAANPTIIDGQNTYRGVAIIGSPDQTPTVTIDSFTIRNGRGNPLTGLTEAHGGGVWVYQSIATLRNLIISKNVVAGANTGAGAGGAANGGGLSILGRVVSNSRTIYAAATLENVTLDGNQAIGGTGPARGGLAEGAGMFSYLGNSNASNITVVNNVASAGRSGGEGREASGQAADALGGGVAYAQGSTGTLSHSTVRNNAANGGGASKYGGNAFGGGVFAELATVNLIANDIRDNTAQGANSVNGGITGGGGVELENSGGTVDRNIIVSNSSLGGNGSDLAGPAGGGGVYIARFQGSTTVNMTNNVIANNEARQGTGYSQGGGGGGIWVQGTSVNIVHNTIVQNAVGDGMIGSALVLLNVGAPTPASVTLAYSIIADHNSGGSAIRVESGSTLTLNRGLWSGNSANTSGGGSINGVSSMISGSPAFQSAGSPNYNYRINSNSSALDSASGSSTKDDIDGTVRPQGRAADIGADEFFDTSNLKPAIYMPITTR